MNINAYVRGANPEIDQALEKIAAINDYLRQEMDEQVSFPQAVQELEAMFGP